MIFIHNPKISLIVETFGCIVFAFFAVLLCSELTEQTFPALPTGSYIQSTESYGYLFTTFFYVFAVSYLLFRNIVKIKSLKLDSEGKKKGVQFGLLLAAINLPYGYILAGKSLPAPYEALLSHSISYVTLFLLVVVFLTPVIEETFYREFLFNKFETVIGHNIGYLISCFLFSWGHDFTLKSLISAAILCYLYDSTKQLGSCVIAHFIWNACWMSVLLF